MNKLTKLALVVAMTISLTAGANAVNIISYGNTWGYYQTQNDSEYSWQWEDSTKNSNKTSEFWTASYSSFDWSKIGSQEGQGSFGNNTTSPYTWNGYTNQATTYWQPGTGLALQKKFDLTSLLINPVLNYGFDNGGIIFINGIEVARNMEEGYGWEGEYSKSLDASLFKLGENTIELLAEDHGSQTWVDVQLSACMTPVPEPATALLGLMSLAGALGLRRRK